MNVISTMILQKNLLPIGHQKKFKYRYNCIRTTIDITDYLQSIISYPLGTHQKFKSIISFT